MGTTIAASPRRLHWQAAFTTKTYKPQTSSLVVWQHVFVSDTPMTNWDGSSLLLTRVVKNTLRAKRCSGRQTCRTTNGRRVASADRAIRREAKFRLFSSDDLESWAEPNSIEGKMDAKPTVTKHMDVAPRVGGFVVLSRSISACCGAAGEPSWPTIGVISSTSAEKNSLVRYGNLRFSRATYSLWRASRQFPSTDNALAEAKKHIDHVLGLDCNPARGAWSRVSSSERLSLPNTCGGGNSSSQEDFYGPSQRVPISSRSLRDVRDLLRSSCTAV